MATPEASRRFPTGAQGPARPESPVIDPLADFAAQRYAGRRNRFIQQFGMKRGPQILAAECGLVTEFVRYMHTPHGQRTMNERAFQEDIVRRGTTVGVHGLLNKGRNMNTAYKEANEKEQSHGS
jgi:hypothetical protein